MAKKCKQHPTYKAIRKPAWAKEAVDLYRERNALKVENERLKQSAVEVAKLNQPNLEQIMALSVEVESLKSEVKSLKRIDAQREALWQSVIEKRNEALRDRNKLRAEVESLKVANLRWQEIADGMNREVESLKAKLAAASARPYFACPECGPTARDAGC